MTVQSVVMGQGSYLPEHVLSNDELAQRMDTSDSWIRERTGITSRHIAAEGEVTSDLAAAACKSALKDANITADMVDALIVATTTPDRSMPSTAAYVQQKIGMDSGFAFDISAACSGFVYGLAQADAMIKSGMVRRVMLVGAETMSRIVDWEDRGTAILFGDGAGAWVIEAQESEGGRGILASKLRSNGNFTGILATSGGVSFSKTTGVIKMQGREVFRHAVENMSLITMDTLSAADIAKEEIDWVIPHQANIRILDAVMRRLGLPESKLICALSHQANTSAATIPLAVANAINTEKIVSGQLLALPALGAGLTWGCTLVRW